MSHFGQNGLMWRSPVLRVIACGYISWGAWNWYIDRSVYPPDGILAPAEPMQADTTLHDTYQIGRWTLTPRATYRITARVLHTERYRFDLLAALIPEDLALGWGPMSDIVIVNRMEISQSSRFYYWRSPRSLPISRDDIISHSANTHVIPGLSQR